MDIVKLQREFGIQLTAGVSCAPGVLINVASTGYGVIANDTSSIVAHGVALTSGSGTKVAGTSQFVTCFRNTHVYDPDNTYTIGAKVYMVDNGLYSGSAPGTKNQIVGFALDANTLFIDLDLVGI